MTTERDFAKERDALQRDRAVVRREIDYWLTELETVREALAALDADEIEALRVGHVEPTP